MALYTRMLFPSVNPDGTIKGLHSLTRGQLAAVRPCETFSPFDPFIQCFGFMDTFSRVKRKRLERCARRSEGRA